jgi:phospholipid/cholesterol/gamma-HCH transport system substrate-binding protein
LEPNDVNVELSLDNDVKLKQDATFAISMLDLMGGKKIEIFPGTSNKSFNISKTAVKVLFMQIFLPQCLCLVLYRMILLLFLKMLKFPLNSLNKYLTDEKLKFKDVKNSLSNLNSVNRKIEFDVI